MAGHLTITSPVPPSLALDFAGSVALQRKALTYQCRIGHAMAIAVDGELLALAMIDVRRPRRAELSLAFLPAARRHMRRLCRLAQLTLRRIADTATLVFARIMPGNDRGARMARLAGFRPGRFQDAAIWVWRG